MSNPCFSCKRWRVFLPLLSLLIFTMADERIYITELLRDPLGGESSIPGGKSHEFVEIYNAGSDTLFLKNLFLSDGRAVDSLIPWLSPIRSHRNCCFNRSFVTPAQYAVILDRDYVLAPVESHFQISDSTVILSVDAASLCNGLTTTKGLFMYRGARQRIDTVLAAVLDTSQTISLGNEEYVTLHGAQKEGVSIIPEGILFDNVAYCLNPSSLSLGSFESEFSGWICSYTFEHRNPSMYEIACTLALCKAGSSQIDEVTWQIVKQDQKTPVHSGELSGGVYPVLLPFSIPKEESNYQFVIKDNMSQDSVPLDISKIWHPEAPLKINELFVRATGAIPEWIELKNTTTMNINLGHWRLIIAEDTCVLSENNNVIEPGAHAIITKKASLCKALCPSQTVIIEPDQWNALNNYSDTLYLVSPVSHKASDSACYTSSWFDHWYNQSLERIFLEKSGFSRSCWALCEKPSPGKTNSTIQLYNTESPKVSIDPIPFSPNGDGQKDQLVISIIHPADYATKLEIYGFSGHKLYTFTKPVAGKNCWNGFTSNGQYAPVGPFFVIATFTNGKREIVVRKKGILWQ